MTAPPFHTTHFRNVLGHFCSGVTIVTSLDAGEPVGFACQSFQSLSLRPPLVSFAPSLTSTTWPRIKRSGRFAVNVLAEGQHDLCRTFAVSGADKFAGVDWSPSRSGSPVLAGALAWIDCEIVNEYEAGDHVIVVGRVDALDAEPAARPLLFFRSAFERLYTADGGRTGAEESSHYG